MFVLVNSVWDVFSLINERYVEHLEVLIQVYAVRASIKWWERIVMVVEEMAQVLVCIIIH